MFLQIGSASKSKFQQHQEEQEAKKRVEEEEVT